MLCVAQSNNKQTIQLVGRNRIIQTKFLTICSELTLLGRTLPVFTAIENIMSPQPQSSSQSLSSSTTSANSTHDPLSLLVKASTSLEEDGGQSSLPQPTRRSPLHQMAVNQQAQGGVLSPLHQMSSSRTASNIIPVGQQQQLDSSILSRMVTAGGTGRGTSNIRVASMQEFRHASMNSLNAVPEKSRLQMRAPNQMFSNLSGQQTVTSSMTSSSSSSNPVRGTPDNPLLKMMEERMAAKKATATDGTTPPATAATTKTTTFAMANMTKEQKSALNASINKWAGIGTHVASANISATQLKPVDETKTSKASPTLAPAQSTQSARNDLLRRLSNKEGSPSRTPLDPSQEKLLQELIQSQTSTSSTNNSPATNNTSPTAMDVQRMCQNPSPMQLGSSAQDFVAQVLLQQQQAQMQQQMVPNLHYHPKLSSARHGIRSAVSLAEIDRLRKANQSVQLRQQMAIQERMNQHFLLQRQMSNGSSPSSTGLPNEFSMRKRRSSQTLEDDTDVVSSRTPSIASSTSCNKIQRSDSHVSVHTSMENLRLHGSRHSGLNMRNQSFSSTSNLKNMNMRNQSFASGLNLSRHHQNSVSGLNMHSVSSCLNMRNQSFSSGSASAAQMGLRRASSKVGMNGMKRNKSSSSWIQSMISTQDTAGKAAATAHQLKSELQKNNGVSEPVAASIEKSVQEEPVQEEEVTKSPIQVTAEEYPAPPLQRGSSETVIISELPDRIKFQNVQIDMKPIDVVKDALSSRDEDANIIPTVDMPAAFFVESEEMYIQEAVDAVRSNDVEALRRLAQAGSNLQCGNRFGETLIHLACRRSHTDVVTFLVKEAGVSIKVRDDYGRTPMHDACWRATVDVDLMDLLMDTCPELLLLSDKRGHTPLDYARREHWDVLIPFLNERKDKFRSIT